MVKNLPPILEVGNVLISTDILTEPFCCDLDVARGPPCKIHSLDEIGEIEASVDVAWPLMSASAQSVVDRQGVAYTDPDGEMVTSIVHGKDCVFTYYHNGCCLCALEKVFRDGHSRFMKPISCALYPLREKRFAGGIVGLNYHRWAICEGAVKRGRELKIPLYHFLREPLIRRFGEEWYKELEEVAGEIEKLRE